MSELARQTLGMVSGDGTSREKKKKTKAEIYVDCVNRDIRRIVDEVHDRTGLRRLCLL